MFDLYDSLSEFDGLVWDDFNKILTMESRLYLLESQVTDISDEDMEGFVEPVFGEIFGIWWDKYTNLSEDSEYAAMVDAMARGEMLEFQMEELKDFLETDGVFDTYDADHDGQINWEEYQAMSVYQEEHMGEVVDDFMTFSDDEKRMMYDAMNQISGSGGIDRRSFLLAHTMMARLFQNANE